MVNLMGASFSTSGTREKTVVTIEGGSAAVEELAMDVLVPSMTQPLFHKWEMTQAWEAALNQPECPFMEAFHATSFTVNTSPKSIIYLVSLFRVVLPIISHSKVVTAVRLLPIWLNEKKHWRLWPETFTRVTMAQTA